MVSAQLEGLPDHLSALQGNNACGRFLKFSTTKKKEFPQEGDWETSVDPSSGEIGAIQKALVQA